MCSYVREYAIARSDSLSMSCSRALSALSQCADGDLNRSPYRGRNTYPSPYEKGEESPTLSDALMMLSIIHHTRKGREGPRHAMDTWSFPPMSIQEEGRRRERGGPHHVMYRWRSEFITLRGGEKS